MSPADANHRPTLTTILFQLIFTCESLGLLHPTPHPPPHPSSPSVSIWPSKEQNAMFWVSLPRASPLSPLAESFPPKLPPAQPWRRTSRGSGGGRRGGSQA